MKNSYTAPMGLISSLFLLNACFSPESIPDAGFPNALVRLSGSDQQLTSELSEFGDFHLCIFDEALEGVETHPFAKATEVPEVRLEPGKYYFLVVANAAESHFELPQGIWDASSRLSLLEGVQRIPQLCFGWSNPVPVQEGSEPVALNLTRVVGKISVSVGNLPASVTAMRVSVNNMYQTVLADGSFEEETLVHSAALEKEEGNFILSELILLPTNGNVELTYFITEGEDTRSYPSKLSLPLESNKILQINTRIEEIKYSVAPKISLSHWADPIVVNDTLTLEPAPVPDLPPTEEEEVDLALSELRFTSLPSDFTPVAAVLTLNVEGQADPVTVSGTISDGLFIPQPSTRAALRTEAAPPNLTLQSVRFSDIKQSSFAVYFGESGEEGLPLPQGEAMDIPLPPPPELGIVFGAGVVISRESTEGAGAYRVRVMAVESRTDSYGTNNYSNTTSESDAVLNDRQLSERIASTPTLSIANFTAFGACRNYRGGGHSDWVLPAWDDLKAFVLLYTANNAALKEVFEGAAAKKISPDASAPLLTDRMPVSHQASLASACYYLTPASAQLKSGDKKESYSIRAVRYL